MGQQIFLPKESSNNTNRAKDNFYREGHEGKQKKETGDRRKRKAGSKRLDSPRNTRNKAKAFENKKFLNSTGNCCCCSVFTLRVLRVLRGKILCLFHSFLRSYAFV